MTVAVLQAGSWGTTLATILARDGQRDVILWTRDADQAQEIAAQRENRRYLPGIRVPDRVEVTADIARALEAEDIIIAAPSIGVGALRERIGALLRREQCVLSATKGLADGGLRMSELWAEVVGRERVAVLSGPNISREIAAGLPAATVIASAAAETAKHFQELVGTPMFRAYTDTDVVGVELSGALKNIVALGAGAIDGMGYGDNAKAGFITRGLAEITVGELLAKGLGLAEIRQRLGGQVAEGVTTAEATYRAAQDAGVTMPITEQTHLVLSDGKPIREAMRDLMQRERGDEVAGPLAELSRLITSTAAARRDDSAARSPSSR